MSFQELATRVSHRNTGKATGCPFAEQLLARIALDENLHMIFYRNLLAAAFDMAPDATMEAVRDEVLGFEMPGANMPGYTPQCPVTIAKAGIYDLRLHRDAVVQPVLKYWNVFTRTDLGPAGEKAREELADFLGAGRPGEPFRRATREHAGPAGGPSGYRFLMPPSCRLLSAT